MVFWCIVGVAIGNLALGFGVAVFLNRRYHTLVLSNSLPLGPPPGSGKIRASATVARTLPDSTHSVEQSLPGGSALESSVLASSVVDEIPQEEVGEKMGSPSNIEGAGKETEPLRSASEAEQSPAIQQEAPGPTNEPTSPGFPIQEASPPETAGSENAGQDNPEEADSESMSAQIAPGSELLETPSQLAEAETANQSEFSPESNRSEDSSEEDSQPGSQRLSPQAWSPQAEKGSVSVSQEDQKEDFLSGLTKDFPPSASAESEPTDRSHSEAELAPSTAPPKPLPGLRGGEEAGVSAPVRGEAQPAVKIPVEHRAEESEERRGTSSQAFSRGESKGISAQSFPPGLEASLERALSQWQAEAARYFEQLSRTRSKVQQMGSTVAPEQVRTSWGEIHQAGQEYLTTARPVREAFSQFVLLRPEMMGVGDHLNTLAVKEEALIEVTQDVLPQADLETQGAGLSRQLIHHTDRLLEASRKVQSALERALNGPAEAEVPGPVSRTSRGGPGSLLEDSVHQKLATWWEEHRASIHHLSVVLFEVDDFEQLEQDYGSNMTERLLRAIEKILEMERRGEGFTIPLTGPRFACFYPNQKIADALAIAEYLRQRLVATRFYRRKTELCISISCGVTEVNREDTPESVLERAEVALLQARRYGKGRTFSHDGYFPMPVPQHSLSIQPKPFEI